MKTKEEWIKELDLEPHVEGGYFRQTYKAIETVELQDKRIRALSGLTPKSENLIKTP